jgi:hypothetical protein
MLCMRARRAYANGRSSVHRKDWCCQVGQRVSSWWRNEPVLFVRPDTSPIRIMPISRDFLTRWLGHDWTAKEISAVRQGNVTSGVAGISCSGSDGTRTRDLRRDRPSRAPRRPATDSSEQAHLQVLFFPTPHRLRMVEPIVKTTFGPRVGHGNLSSWTMRNRREGRHGALRALWSGDSTRPPPYHRGLKRDTRASAGHRDPESRKPKGSAENE